MDILSQIDHPNTVKLFEIFDEDDRICLVMEHLGGGELFDRIVEKESYSEKEDNSFKFSDCLSEID